MCYNLGETEPDSGCFSLANRSLIERKCYTQAQQLLGKVMTVATDIDNQVVRADALFLLWQAVFPLDNKQLQILADRLVEACAGVKHWKAQNILRDSALMSATRDRAVAGRIVRAMLEGKQRRQAVNRLAIGEYQTPRAFFQFQS